MRTVDGSVDVRLGGQVHDGGRLMRDKHAGHPFAIGNIGADERDPRIAQRTLEVEQASGVGQLIENDQPIGGVAEGVANEIRADEPRASGDEKSSYTAAPSGY